MVIDSSVLVAGFFHGHTHFIPSIAFLSQLDNVKAHATAHSLAETFSSVTQLPIFPKPSAWDAKIYIESLTAKIDWLEMKQDYYHLALQLMTQRGFTGAKIYDALIVAAAMMIKSKVIYTWNVKHFLPLAEGSGILIRTPDHYVK